MVQQVKAKMRVNFKGDPGYSHPDQKIAQVNLSAVYSDDKSSENYSYSKATPSANLSMTITNPDAVEFFEPGAEYVLTFERADKQQPSS
jgi:hypothetical protein